MGGGGAVQGRRLTFHFEKLYRPVRTMVRAEMGRQALDGRQERYSTQLNQACLFPRQVHQTKKASSTC